MNTADLIARYAADFAKWGHLLSAMRFKRSLVELLGPEEAFPIVVKQLRLPDASRLMLRPVEPLLDHARKSPGVRWLWLGGQPFLHPELNVLGQGDRTPMRGRSRAGWLASFDNVTLRGRSSLLHMGEKVLRDVEEGESTGFSDNPEYDPWILNACDEGYWMMEPTWPSLTIDEAFMLTGGRSIDFGYWMSDYLPKLGMAMRAGWRGEMPVLVDQTVCKTIRDALPSLLPSTCTLIELPHLGTIQVGRLWCVPALSFTGFYPTEWDKQTWEKSATHPSRFGLCVGSALSQVEQTRALCEPSGMDRLFLARREEDDKASKIVADLEALIAEHRFAKVYPEELPFLEQIRLVRHARFIVASDALSSLAVFARRGTKLCILSPPCTYPLADLNAALQALQIHASVVTGPDSPADEFSPFWYDYKVELPVLSRFFGDWLGDGSGEAS
jgi:hypothetical protein